MFDRLFRRTPRQEVDGVVVTDRLRRILSAMLDGPPATPLDLCRRARIKPGSAHPDLARVEVREWVASEWETPDPLPDRHRRRFYRLTPLGRTRALGILGRYRGVGRHRPSEGQGSKPHGWPGARLIELLAEAYGLTEEPS